MDEQMENESQHQKNNLHCIRQKRQRYGQRNETYIQKQSTHTHNSTKVSWNHTRSSTQTQQIHRYHNSTSTKTHESTQINKRQKMGRFFKTNHDPVQNTCSTLILTMTQYIRLERIQRQAVRKSIFWPQGVSTKDIYQQIKIQSIHDHAIYLTNNYIRRAYNLNIIIKELIDEYNTAQELDEGAYCRTAPRSTILGKIKQINIPCSRLLTTNTTQLQQMQILTQTFFIFDTIILK